MKVHHISLLTGDFERNYHMYVDVLGLRFIKNSINQGNIYMRHVYYGDFMGTPGSVVTFFPDKRFDRERRDGKNYLSGIRFKIPKGSLDYWQQRLTDFDFELSISADRIEFRDWDAIPITLQETDEILEDWRINILSDVPADKQLTGLLGTQIATPNLSASTEFFNDMADGLNGVELIETSADSLTSVWGRGSVDHIAFVVNGKKDLDAIWEKALQLGYMRESYVDRGYFSSVYLIDPAGNRIEFATLTPGFTLDESLQNLGTTFALPPRYEERRAELQHYFEKEGVRFDKVKPVKFDEDVTVIEGEVHRDRLHL